MSEWSRSRRAIVLGRRVKDDLVVVQGDSHPLRLGFAGLNEAVIVSACAVLITALPPEILTLAPWYRDRADTESPFDELKNHWGWGGFTNRDLKRCRFMAPLTAMTSNGWSRFARPTNPHQHTEAINRPPLRLQAPARVTRHAGQTRLTLSHPSAEARWVGQVCCDIGAIFKGPAPKGRAVDAAPI